MKKQLAIYGSDGKKSSTKLRSKKQQKIKKRITILNSSAFSPQEFSWGVLAVNPNKTIYLPNKSANLALAVLDDKGMMVCDAKIKLEIISPEGKKLTYDTEHKTIQVNPECKIHDVT